MAGNSKLQVPSSRKAPNIKAPNEHFKTCEGPTPTRVELYAPSGRANERVINRRSTPIREGHRQCRYRKKSASICVHLRLNVFELWALEFGIFLELAAWC